MPAIALLGLAGFAEDAAAFVVPEGRLHQHPRQHQHQHQRQHRCRGQRARGLAETKLKMAAENVVDVKSKVLQLAAAMDRGGMANPGKRWVYFLLLCCCQEQI